MDTLPMMEDFGQRVDLTRRIREVLVNYPEGTTVLKELIQNADDAGATTVRLCLDRRSHGVRSLLSDRLAGWQGPALLAYNDAVFTEDDFVSISRIGDSKKQGQAWKTGRFGVGFNSVYHLTDLPSFVSGKHVVIFDPQGAYLPNVSAANPGKRLDYVSSSAISLYKDQFLPYCAFGCDMKGPFLGTLFRFPLRNADQAENSKLSRQAYSEDDISSMFLQLYKEAVFSILFLKNILLVEMYMWDHDAQEPHKLYSCSVNSVNSDIVWHRQAILRASKAVRSAVREIDCFLLDFLSESINDGHSKTRIDTFFIVQSMAPASSRISAFAAAAAKEYDFHLLPWASVGACISNGLSEDDVLKQGQAFCFLPLPVRTGLNVQVNGYFEVSSNRRGIWFGADMDRAGKLRSDWNKLLLVDVVAQLLNGSTKRSVVDQFCTLMLQEENGYAQMKHLFMMRYATNIQKRMISPRTVRNFLRECENIYTLNKIHRLVLLEYCLSDLLDADVGEQMTGLPLLPLASEEFGLFSEASKGHLYKASKSSKLINVQYLSDTLKELLENIGCKILDPKYGIDHRDLYLYVYDANGAGVLSAISETISSEGDSSLMISNNFADNEINELREFLFDPKWYIGGTLSDSHLKICKKLPIFRLYGGSPNQSHHFSDLARSQKYLPPVDIPDFLLDREFIHSSSNTEEGILSRYFGIQRMGRAFFYRQKVLNRIENLLPELRDNVMISILRDLPQLCIEDASLRESLKSLKFVTTISGTLKCPQSLYDPRIEELCALLEDSDCFPSDSFQDSGVLDMLQGLGLQTSVSSDTVIRSAHQVELMMHSDPLKAHSRGKALLSYLEANANKWLFIPPNNHKKTMKLSKVAAAFMHRDMPLDSDLEKFWNDLRMICWCPVLVIAPLPTLPWPSASSTVAPPKLVRPLADMWLVSASMRILDGDYSSTALMYGLGWSVPPSGSVIAAQLLELGKNNDLVIDQVFRQELALAMPKIYSLLMALIGSDEMEIVKAVLEGCRWIWVGDGFATVDEVVLKGHLHLAPYIRVIPVDLEVFRDLFVELGIRESLKPIDYASILCRMAIKKDRDPLDVQELRAAILVVQHLAEVQFQDLQVQIYLPDMSARLCPATDLVYNDAPWLLGPEESASEHTFTIPLTTKKNTHKLVHGNISNDIAERLGVCSLRRLLLAESSDSMNLSLSGVAEAFGQHEDLTTRLKHIVEMYADGPGILFELMQNAEDAGASEVVFLLDRTQYGTSSILSPEMADWQGPALYCFNNSVFSPQDLYAISRIGQDSKLENPSAIGRFGLGFNCVYHFTDVPSFVSGENIVMFDPHACHLPGISPSHPGLRIKFVGRRILDQFPDQFAPFLHFGCDLQNPYPGTLFRFPLRNENAASRSQIKKEKYAAEDVLSLFSSFSEVVAEVLLFLRNVNSVSILIKDGSTPEVQLVHRVSRQHIKSKGEPHLLHSMLDFVRGNKKSGMDKEQFLNKLNKTVDKDLPWSCQKIVIKEWKSCGEKLHIWITGECLGGGRAKSKSLVHAKKSHNFIPWACVAAHLISSNTIDVQNPVDGLNMELNQNTTDSLWVPADSTLARKEFEGRAFCFLPLPISTGLPAHVNAYFELSSNRRDIWFGNDMAGGGKVRSDWNTFLIEDAIAPAYGHLLEHIAVEIGPCDLYYSFWPTATQREPWASMIRKLYTFISDNSLQVLYTKARGGQWISTKQAIFPDFAFPRASELAEVLSESGLPLVTVSPPVVERFMEAYPSLHFLTPQLLRSLLIRRRRGFKNKEAMILTLEYCLSDLKGPGTCDCLHGLPLIPLANGSFTVFTKPAEGERIFLAFQNEYYLLKDLLPHLLVECTLPDGVLKSLHDIAQIGETNISFLTCNSLVELLPKLLPTEWQYAKRVSWNPNHLGQPSVEWMALLWSYLKSSCNDLSIFSDWPILPVSDGCLLQLVVNSYVIKDGGWSENMSSLLQKLGCLFLRSDIMVDHSQLKNFVQDASATGILNALHSVACQRQDIEGLFCVASEAEMHELRSFIFQSKWFNDNQMISFHIDTIKLLPIFESYKSRKYVSLTNPVKCLKPDGISEDLLNEEFVRTESERERNIMRSFLGIKEPSRAEFYKDYVLNRMSEIILEPPVLSAILFDVKVLIEEDSSFKSALSQMSFVLAANGVWKHPSKFYDPRIPGFQKLLHKEAFFPSEKFSSTEILETLVSMGLKRNLGFTGLLDCAQSVSMMHHSGDSQAMSYGQRLLLCLDFLGFKIYGGNNEETRSKITNEISNQESGGLVNDDTQFIHYSETDNEKSYLDPDIQHCLDTIVHDIPEDQLWSEMMTIDWCPVYVDPPIQGLPWFTSISCVASPEFVRPSSQMWLVSSKMRILDGECCSDYVQGKLGWMNSPSISVLSTQLIELSRSYCQIKLQSVEEPLISTVLQREIPALYSKLQDSVSSSDFVTLKASLDGVPWVWIGDNFVLPKHLAFDSPVKYHPYLYVVPTELSEFRILLSELGVKLTFDTVDYLHVLQHLQHDLKGEPLSPEQLNFVHRVLEAVVDCFADKQVGDALLSSVLIPDSSGILMCAADLVYNDAPWMEKNSILNKHFTHPIINDDLAKRLGVQSLRCLSLVNEEMTKDLPFLSCGNFYIFDPRGLVLPVPPSKSPSAKMFTLTEHCFGECSDFSLVSLYTWSIGNSYPSLQYSISVDPSIARNPFSDKKWRKFQISKLFSSSHAAIKLNAMDVHVLQGETKVVDKWLIALSMGSGQTRNMALDSFIKEHYPVFSVPWELVSEIQAVGVTVKEIKPKMPNDRTDIAGESSSDMLAYPDAASFNMPRSHDRAGNDALEMMTTFGKALYDLGRGMVEDIGERERFPGDRFATDGWLHILRKTGLRTSLEADVIVECTRKIESLGIESMRSTVDPDGLITEFSDQNEVSTELWSLATSLVDSIFLNFALLYSNTFCNTVSKISFVPAEKGFPSISGKKGGKRVLSSYGDAILLKDWPLAWSSAPILSRKVVPPEYSWGVFHLSSPPAFPLVLKHLQEMDRDVQLEILNEIGSVSVKTIKDKLLRKSLQMAVWMVINSKADYMPSIVLGLSIALPLGPLLSSPDDSEKAILDVLKLGSEKGENNFGHRNNVLIGSELLVQDALLVQFLPLRPFYAGEIVAWRMGKDGEKLKYGRVPEDVRPSSGQALYRFNVETSLGESQLLLSSQVFSFKSMSSREGSSSSSSQESIITKVGTKTMPQISSDNGSSGSQQSSKQPQCGQVSAQELVQAVHDMLSTAGIDMDSEKQTLLQTTLNLQEQLKESQATLLLEQEKADLAAKEADAAKAAWD
ncbi:hypothetical protein QJS10_CPA01g00101 [Acorus calamus]|uniref:Sacsin/Nov domain-containing protein n=1 Tax=Acorus calamus TaxID=4465 RepID=A0AAV9FIB5_ACOCL|nr:hypothetical protein QJS10_CPA01g00101 [Acorus calamus]